MNFFIISDIHGSESALKKALEIYKNGIYDKLLICGDILYHGARNPLPDGYNPKGVIDLLNEIKEKLIVVRGNCESEVDSMVLNFPISGDYSYVYTKDKEIFLTHGHKYTAEKSSFLSNGSIFLSGHTHIPMAENNGKVYIFNPGSISLPKGGYPPTYGILRDNIWEVCDLNTGDIVKSLII